MLDTQRNLGENVSVWKNKQIIKGMDLFWDSRWIWLLETSDPTREKNYTKITQIRFHKGIK